jgi:hypothetical protein
MNTERIPTGADMRKIRLLGCALLILGLCVSNTFALDFMGPPTTEIVKGAFRAGVDYAYSSMDLKLIEGKGSVFDPDGLVDSGNIVSVTINDFEVNTLYASMGYGIFDNCEGFVRLGAAKATFGDVFWDQGEEFDSDIDFAAGAGIKANFYNEFNWRIGGLIQINRLELDGKVDSSSWVIPQPQFVDLTTTEIQIAIGATYMYSRRLTIYGGPFAHFISGDLDFEFSLVGDEIYGDFSYNINEGPTFGGYIGAQINLSQKNSANFEYQHSSDADVLGASLVMRF